MTYLLVLGGFLLLFFGGEALVRGSVGVARKLGVSELIIGLTLVGFGTSMPEMVTTLRAVQAGEVGLGLGNVVGSNIANILLVVGMAAMLAPIVVSPRALGRDTLAMVLFTAAFILLAWFDLFTRPVGAVLVLAVLGYIVVSLLMDRGDQNAVGDMHREEAEMVEPGMPLALALLFAVAGIAGVVFGAQFLVEGAVQLAEQFGLSETVIGLTLVAIGTSLPELATSIIAATKGRSDVALGNILGSNIFNLAGIVGVTALVHPFSTVAPVPQAAPPLSVDPDTGMQIRVEQGFAELPVLAWEHIGALILATFLLVLFAFTGRKIARWEGIVLLGGYVLYLGMLFDFVPTPFS
ncbi:MAG: calcium/sodium antiporter [Pseudomonadota bacterium]